MSNRSEYFTGILSNGFKISNYGLATDKFGRFKDETLDYIDRNGRDKLYHKFYFSSHKQIIAYLQSKQSNIQATLKNSGYLVESIHIEQNWRLVLNLGQATAYNNGFLLHPVYGIPYLSESAIKGMVRTYVIESKYAFDEKKALENDEFRALFGSRNSKDNTNEQQGLVHFAPAYPTNSTNDGQGKEFTIEADIINSLNKDYYGDDKEYPTEENKGNPLKFITLKNAEFKPYVYVKPNAYLNEEKAKDLLDKMIAYIKEAFEIKGIGAKTNKGYGRLLINRESQLKSEELRKINLRKEEQNSLREKTLKEIKSKKEQRIKILRDKGLSYLTEEATGFKTQLTGLSYQVEEYKSLLNIEVITKEEDIEAIKRWFEKFMAVKGKGTMNKKKKFINNSNYKIEIASWIGLKETDKLYSKYINILK